VTKGPDAFRTISEAADELGVPQHVLRFWETKFSFIRPMKRAGGRRFYRRQDIEVLRGVRRLLHDEGYTIKGVQRLHTEQGIRRLLATAEGVEPPPADLAADAVADAAAEATSTLGAQARSRLQAVLSDLETTKGRIDDLLHPGG
jgi:DNA-binding transcriptional MerR regulator